MRTNIWFHRYDKSGKDIQGQCEYLVHDQTATHLADKESNLQTITIHGNNHGEADVLHRDCPRTQFLQKVGEKPSVF